MLEAIQNARILPKELVDQTMKHLPESHRPIQLLNKILFDCIGDNVMGTSALPKKEPKEIDAIIAKMTLQDKIAFITKATMKQFMIESMERIDNGEDQADIMKGFGNP